ncbi:MAG: arginine--tRNA ligase [Lachnospiraceae bacterium]|nr:arginine--tRNA ligase [Lachnospiraceae bacterium]
MKQFLDQLSEEMGAAFEKAGFDAALGRVGISNRPDLCEYQCNGAMAGAKKYGKKPIDIANAVAEELKASGTFSSVEAVMPGFLNLNVNEEYLAAYVREMLASDKFGVEAPEKPLKIVIDYGGPNVAKPLHVGHLRPAVIGESIKRIARFAGHDVTGDVHLGDWGLQMGLVIVELGERQPDLPYFDEAYEGEYPEEPPFSLKELEEIYPTASAKSKSKEDDPEEVKQAAKEYHARALQATREMQQGRRGYRALWKHIMAVSLPDLKENYRKMDIEFDLWMGESDVNDLIPAMVDDMKAKGLAHISEGALVVDVKEESDKKELPPCMILKSDGAANYETTDLATILWREKELKPDKILYVVDKRQELHFVQVFRCARKCGLVREETGLEFIGFGTMNGPGGKPFKTRDGGVLQLKALLDEIAEKMHTKIRETENADAPMSEEEAWQTARITALAALKYGDLSNQAAKDYIFDVERFTASEGDTGPYLLYTMARIKSILRKYEEKAGASLPAELAASFPIPEGKAMKALCQDISGFIRMIDEAFAERAPHKVCAYLYQMANDLNSFYHETKILAEPDEKKQAGYIGLIRAVLAVMEECIGLLGFSAPERM